MHNILICVCVKLRRSNVGGEQSELGSGAVLHLIHWTHLPAVGVSKPLSSHPPVGLKDIKQLLL